MAEFCEHVVRTEERVLGVRVLGILVLGIRVLGIRILGIRVLGIRILGIRVLLNDDWIFNLLRVASVETEDGVTSQVVASDVSI